MREILFRGRRRNGEWIEGNYIFWNKKHCIYDGIYYEVLPETIGQTVYAVTKGDDLWWKGTVASICYEFNEMSYGISFDDGDFAMFEEEDVFPTKKEAEAKLKENET